MNTLSHLEGSQQTYIRAPLRRGAATGPSARRPIWNQLPLARHLVVFRGLRPLEKRAGYTLALPVSGLKNGVHLMWSAYINSILRNNWGGLDLSPDTLYLGEG